MLLQFLIGVAEERGAGVVHRQVGEVIEGGEDGELGEARDAGHHHEADVADVVLDFTVEGGELGSDGLGLLDVVERVADGRVVFVDEDDHRLAAVPGEGSDGVGEVVVRGERGVIGDAGVLEGPPYARHKPSLEDLERRDVHGAEVEMEDGVRLPVIVHLVDGEALEERALAAEEAFQRREHQRLAEPTRTGDEEEAIAIPCNERIQQRRLVHIAIAFLPHDAEVVGPLRDFLFFHGSAPAHSIAQGAERQGVGGAKKDLRGGGVWWYSMGTRRGSRRNGLCKRTKDIVRNVGTFAQLSGCVHAASRARVGVIGQVSYDHVRGIGDGHVFSPHARRRTLSGDRRTSPQ